MVSRDLSSGDIMEIMPRGCPDTLDVGVRETKDLMMFPRTLVRYWKHGKTVG